MNQNHEQHAKWLGLIDHSGSFLAETMLSVAFPQGLPGLEGSKKTDFNDWYAVWRDDIENPTLGKEIKETGTTTWIHWILSQGLEWDEHDNGEDLKAGDAIPKNIKLERPEYDFL